MKKKGMENPKTALRKLVPVFSLKYRDTPAMRIIKPIANEIMARKRKLILSLIFQSLVCLLLLCRFKIYVVVPFRLRSCLFVVFNLFKYGCNFSFLRDNL
jgi:hypothetical protein